MWVGPAQHPQKGSWREVNECPVHNLGTEVWGASEGDEAPGSWETNLACRAKGRVPSLEGEQGRRGDRAVLAQARPPSSLHHYLWWVPWGTGQRRERSPLAQSRHHLNSGFCPSLAPPPLAGWDRRKSPSEDRVMFYCK